MIRRCPMLATVLLLATLLAGRAVGEPEVGDPRLAFPSPAEGVRQPATPLPQVLVGQPPAWEPLPTGCEPERTVHVVLDFLDAFNDGDQDRLAALFRPDVLDADGTPDPGDDWRNPGWFSAHPIAAAPGVMARDDAELLPWVASRHAQYERWTLLQLFMGGYWWRGSANISFDMQREADDVPAQIVGGKGAIDCDDGTVFLWNVGSTESLPDYLFEPGATPAPAVGLAPAPQGS